MTDQIQANASATKGFFVDMLVRDISVNGAILDLIDNAVDAADAVSMHNSLEGYRIDVEITPSRFTIADNCGGIPLDIAQNYAFRFGRPEGFTPHTQIGQFGIGMKRALFRLGRKFKVDSSTDEGRFIMDVDVEQWRKEEDDRWTFPMSIADKVSSEKGTTVEVWNLHENVVQLFAREDYPRRMRNEAKERYAQMSKRGLEIVLNNEPASMSPYEILSGSGITPEHQEYTLDSNGHRVNVRLIAGIGPPRRPARESGWYIYCNGRLVLKADRTELTGWGMSDPTGGSGSPAWHSQYNQFRGFVFFTSEQPSALPWTTTKNEIDATADVYRNTLQRMRSIIIQFSNFTNNLKQEREKFEEGDGSTPQLIQETIDKTPYKAIDAIPQGEFKVPEREKSSTLSIAASPKTTSIQFNAEIERVKKIKHALRLSTNRQIGERAFERLYDEEIGED